MHQTCILVLGMHRSGTSALTGLLHNLNVFLGSKLQEANKYNQKGYFENEYIVTFNEYLLTKLNSSWDDVFFNSENIGNLVNEEDYKKLENIILQEFNNQTLFAIKDPRICYLFPIYEKVLSKLKINIKIILPLRKPNEVAYSLYKRDNFNINKSMLLWLNYTIYAELFTRKYPRCILEFDTLINKPNNTLQKIDKEIKTNFLHLYKKR